MFNTLHINNLNVNRKTSLPCQANESKYESPPTERTALTVKKPVAVLPPLQRRYLDVHTCIYIIDDNFTYHSHVCSL